MPLFTALAFLAAARANADEPDPGKTAPPQGATPSQPLQVATEPQGATPTQQLRVVTEPQVMNGPQVATEPPAEPSRTPLPPMPPPRVSDGAGPRLTFGRAWTDTLNDGFYGRFETEYFEVKGWFIRGMLLGLEGWGTEGATAGGASIPVSMFAGMRGGPFRKPKAPVLFLTAGLGVHVLVYDRIGDADGFGLLSPFAVATGGVEIVPGIRLLADGRIAYRWHWTAASQAQFQAGVTLGLNSYLWDGP